jgi:hypothetical protein
VLDAYAVDASGYHLHYDSAVGSTLTDRAGTLINAAENLPNGDGSRVDSNGNVITSGATTMTDTLGTNSPDHHRSRAKSR